MPLTVQLALGVLVVMAMTGTIVWRAASAFDKTFPDSARIPASGGAPDERAERRIG